jgi:hypothetical protein
LAFLHLNEGSSSTPVVSLARTPPKHLREYYMVLTDEERVVLRDVLDIEIESFEDAMHKESRGEGFVSWESLLSTTGDYGNTLRVLRDIRKKVASDAEGL